MNSNMVKPEKLDHRHLVYYFTVPLMNAMFTQHIRQGSLLIVWL